MERKRTFFDDLLFSFWGTIFSCAFTGHVLYYSYWVCFSYPPIYTEVYGYTDKILSSTGTFLGIITIGAMFIALVFKRNKKIVYTTCILLLIFFIQSIISLFQTKKMTKLDFDKVKDNYFNSHTMKMFHWEQESNCHGLKSINNTCKDSIVNDIHKNISRSVEKNNIKTTQCCDKSLENWYGKTKNIFWWFFTYFFTWFVSLVIIIGLYFYQNRKHSGMKVNFPNRGVNCVRDNELP